MSFTFNDTETKTSSTLDNQHQSQFDWKNCWYPVTFVRDFTNGRPYGFTLYDEPFVLFRDKIGKLACLADICPHRAAPLSEGQIIDGKIECLYHGWQFDLEGKCQHIPQLPEEAAMPRNACVKSFSVVEKQGIIWFWRGGNESADEDLIPTIPNADSSDIVSTDCVIDLPYDQSYLMENVIDPAHVHISHHESLGNRQNAQPLEMEILESSIEGIKIRYKYAKQANGNWVNLNFVAPNLVTYGFTINNKITIGTALYSIPTGRGNCRLLLRGYKRSNWKTKLTPRWLSHWETNRVLEEDSVFIVGEQSIIESRQESMQKIFLPLKTSDVLVVEYRKWLDRYGKNLPFYQGYTTSKLTEVCTNVQDKGTLDRFKQHTQICSSCSQAYQTTIRIKQVLIGIAIALAAIAILTERTNIKIAIVILSLLSVILAVVAEKIKTKFELPYTRE
jgi:phenylpropionate dioxygenase-like ring-hydroxylating dioxygenase large terminal subunit